MSALVLAGLKATQLILQLIGCRSITSAIVSLGPILIKAAIKTFGGPLSYVPQSILNKLVDRIFQGPLVLLLGGQGAGGFIVRAALVVLSTAKDGVKYLLINVASKAAKMAIHAIKNHFLGLNANETQKVIHVAPKWEVIEDYTAEHQLRSAEKRYAKLSEQKSHTGNVLPPPSSGGNDKTGNQGGDSPNSNHKPATGVMPMMADLKLEPNSVLHTIDGIEIIECSNEELERMVSSLPPTKSMIDADQLNNFLTQSVTQLENSSDIYPQLADLSNEDEIEEWVLAHSTIEDSSADTQKQDQVQRDVDPLLRSWLEVPPATPLTHSARVTIVQSVISSEECTTNEPIQHAESKLAPQLVTAV